MMDKETGGPAFPTEVWDEEGIPRHTQGMTLRDYFAAKALQGMPATDEGIRYPMDKLSTWAYAQADSMMKARKQ